MIALANLVLLIAMAEELALMELVVVMLDGLEPVVRSVLVWQGACLELVLMECASARRATRMKTAAPRSVLMTAAIMALATNGQGSAHVIRAG